MDFKVACTKKGITAIQMDIKVQGITIAIMREAMASAKTSRNFIIDKLAETIAEPRRELSKFAPRMIVVKIDPAKIKDVIGPGGKIINKIIADTGVTKIDIEDDGSVYITSADGESGDKARTIVENLTKEIAVGQTYQGTVTRIIPIGAFVQILPGKEGLVHISQLAPQRVEKVEDVVSIGDSITVKVMEIDPQGRLNLSRKALLGPSNGSSGPASAGDRPRRPAREYDDDRSNGNASNATNASSVPEAPAPAPASVAPAAAAPAADAPGAPPMRRRRRPQGRRDD
jgi:polyribonucleotide nucleotidyltransferase